ncbi:MAG: hypothetical protein B9S33_01465 [Pedosphaera sp. Tous-C6FEB]|nr:MAG: hypothetical protein B9S33_01465 [Pedosphaera sp. Tous-C6FEB]
MLRKLLPFLALGLALTGCIEFERQTMTCERDAKADTLHIHQTYHGIYGADDVTQLSAQEREQLADVMKGQRTFFFANWIFELSVGSFKEQLAQEAEPKKNSLEEAQRRAATNLLALLVANVRVENGKFYLNDKGQPCGTQRVTLRNVSKLLAAGNEVIRRGLEVEMKDKPAAAERELFNASLARREPFITLAGQQIRFRWPYAKAEFDKIGTDDVKLERFVAEFVRQGGQMSHAQGEMHLRFGHTDATRETITLPMIGKGYQANALGHVRDTFGLAKDFDPKKDTEDFLRAKAVAPKK